MPAPFELGVLSTEISDDIDVVSSVTEELGMKWLDIRRIDGATPDAFSDEHIAKATSALDRHGLLLKVIRGPNLKGIGLDDVDSVSAFLNSDIFKREMELFRRCFAVARSLGASHVRAFTFKRTRRGPVPDPVLEVIAAAIGHVGQAAADHELGVMIENVESCWADTGVNSARIIDAVGRDNVKLTWDPANALVSGEDALEVGYPAAKPHIGHVDIKDVRFKDKAKGTFEWACVGKGELDCQAHLRRLAADGYSDVVVLETHWKPEGKTPEQATRESFAALTEIVDRL